MDEQIDHRNMDQQDSFISPAPLSLEMRIFRSYSESSDVLRVEEVSAALARVETILRCLGYPLPGISVEEKLEGDSLQESFAKSYSLRLLELMKREPALAPYLRQQSSLGHKQSISAWAAAAGDVSYLRQLREYGWESHGARFLSIMKIIGVPVLLIVLTALLGNVIATTLQRAAFEHQKTFDLRLDNLRKGQDRSAELYTSMNDIYATFSDAEGHGFRGLGVQRLRAQRQKLDSISAASRLYDTTGSVGRSIKKAADLLDQYIVCLRDKAREEAGNKISSRNCSKRYNLLPAFDQILDAHTVAIAKLSEESRK